MGFSLGYNECVTYRFNRRGVGEAFRRRRKKRPAGKPAISSEMNANAPALPAGAVAAAADGNAGARVRRPHGLNSSLGAGVLGRGSPESRHTHVTGLLVGHTGPRDPMPSRRPVDVFDVRTERAVSRPRRACKGANQRRSRLVAPGSPGYQPRRRSSGIFGELTEGCSEWTSRGPAWPLSSGPGMCTSARAKGPGRARWSASPTCTAVERDFRLCRLWLGRRASERGQRRPGGRQGADRQRTVFATNSSGGRRAASARAESRWRFSCGFSRPTGR